MVFSMAEWLDNCWDYKSVKLMVLVWVYREVAGLASQWVGEKVDRSVQRWVEMMDADSVELKVVVTAEPSVL